MEIDDGSAGQVVGVGNPAQRPAGSIDVKRSPLCVEGADEIGGAFHEPS